MPSEPSPIPGSDATASVSDRQSGTYAPADYVPPPLPPMRSDLAHVVIPATVLWFVAFVVLLFFTDSLRANNHMIYLWTCLAGGVLGCIGLSIYFWQRAAARRGTRSANTMALDEKL